MAQSILLTKPLKGQLYPNLIRPKGPISELKFPKGPLEELAAEYNFSKPDFSLIKTIGPPNDRRFYVRCVMEDVKHGNLFIQTSDGETRIKLAEHAAAKKILQELEKTYFFSEEKNQSCEAEIEYVICPEEDQNLRIKLYKWQNCCEYCYLRGHVIETCSKQVKRNKNLTELETVTEEDFWNSLDEID